MQLPSLWELLRALLPRGTVGVVCWALFFLPFVFYFLTGPGALSNRPAALDVGIVGVSAALGGLVLNAGLNLKGSKRKETVQVAQKFISVVILMIIFLPALHFVELMDGIDTSSVQLDSLESWARGFFFWVGAISFFLGISLFIVALADLVYAMLGIDRPEHASGEAYGDSGQDSPSDVETDSVEQEPRREGILNKNDSSEERDETSLSDLAIVTGAFGYTGGYVARRLIDHGVRVRTLTRRTDGRQVSRGVIDAAPMDFSDPDGLRRSMEGASVLYNTYWIRYAHGQMTFDRAVENTGTLFKAAKEAGVGKIVHFSVSNSLHDSNLPYFRAKAQVEEMLMNLGLPYAIIRPTLVYGDGDLLLNNMAWALRRFPVFFVYGCGDYPVQPVHVQDVAAQAVEAGSQDGNSVADAAGPDTFSLEDVLRMLASAMGVRARLLHAPLHVSLAVTQLVGLMKGDLALTRDEVVGLMAGLLTSKAPPTGKMKLSDWLADNADGLGRRYVSELRRNWSW